MKAHLIAHGQLNVYLDDPGRDLPETATLISPGATPVAAKLIAC
jgi:hypothetical protein